MLLFQESMRHSLAQQNIEEIKTWKKIDDTKKRTNEILSLKKRNEERIQKVSQPFPWKDVTDKCLCCLENLRLPSDKPAAKDELRDQLRDAEEPSRREEKSARGHLPQQEGRGKVEQDDQATKRSEEETHGLQGWIREQDEEPDCQAAETRCISQDWVGQEPPSLQREEAARWQGGKRGLHEIAKGGGSHADGETWDGADQEVAEHTGYPEGCLLGVGACPQGAKCHDEQQHEWRRHDD